MIFPAAQGAENRTMDVMVVVQRNPGRMTLSYKELGTLRPVRVADPLHRAAGVLRRAPEFGTTHFFQAMARKIMAELVSSTGAAKEPLNKPRVVATEPFRDEMREARRCQ